MDSLDQEIELLRNAPPSPENRPQTTAEKDTDAWRLDAPPPKGMFDDRGPLLDQSGKVDRGPLYPLIIPYTFSASETVHDTSRRCD